MCYNVEYRHSSIEVYFIYVHRLTPILVNLITRMIQVKSDAYRCIYACMQSALITVPKISWQIKMLYMYIILWAKEDRFLVKKNIIM